MFLPSRRDVLKYGAALGMTPMFSSSPEVAEGADVATPPKVDPYKDAKFVDGEAPRPAADSFTIAVLPDTQNYSEKYPEQFFAQTEWVAKNIKARKIASLLHLGDITNRSTPVEWETARKAMSRLDNELPYFMTLGNHDYSDGGKCADRTTRLNEYFPVSMYRQRSTFGGTYDREPERMENCFHLFAVGDREFLVLSLEFGPRNDVIRWANEVVAKHKQREAILITHAYMYYDETRYDWAKHGKDQRWNPHNYLVAKATEDDINDGEQMWQKLVSRHENFILTLNGHVLDDGLGRLTTATPGGRGVHQLLVNFQMKPNGGDGWLRLLEFKADRRTVEVYDYSPTRNQWNASTQNRFTIRTAPVG